MLKTCEEYIFDYLCIALKEKGSYQSGQMGLTVTQIA